jgi:hypothetical protein
MSKRKKRGKTVSAEAGRAIVEVARTGISISPDATVGPFASFEQPSSISWGTADTTNAPEIGQSEEEHEPYAGSQWALLDKYLLGKTKLIKLSWIPVIIFMGVIITQDNGAGKLIDWMSVWWTIQKCGLILAIYMFGLSIYWLLGKIFK